MLLKVDLTKGNIAFQLTKVSLPIMFTMFVQMAYNITDMFWIGRIGTGAVAAVGSVGFFTWLGMAITLMPKIGLEVYSAQSAGQNDEHRLRNVVINGLGVCVFLAFLYSIISFYFAPSLIHFFHLGDNTDGFDPTTQAIIYFRFISLGFIFAFLNPCFSAIYNGIGKSKWPFYFNSVGLILNMILDPLLIYGNAFFPRLEVKGAAWATIISQCVVAVLFYSSLRKHFPFLKKTSSILRFNKEYSLKIIRIGLPPSLQSMMFAVIAIVIARIISQWGAVSIAVQRIGSQIEAISWMTASGFSTAVSTFVGQNFGAGKITRIRQGFLTATGIMTGVGIINSLVLFLFPEFLYQIFVREPDTIQQGVVYLTIVSFSQLFMCLETATQGAFNGVGNSLPPSIVGIVFNTLRIPASLLLSSTCLGITGIWWTISISSIMKGLILWGWFALYFTHRWGRT